MKDPVVHEALRQIQEIVAQESGKPLTPAARERVPVSYTHLTLPTILRV